jgi:hypothetical protein
VTNQMKKASKKHKLTRAEVIESINELEAEIIRDVREIAEQQRYQVEHGRDSEITGRIADLEDNAVPTVRILASPVRYRGADV